MIPEIHGCVNGEPKWQDWVIRGAWPYGNDGATWNCLILAGLGRTIDSLKGFRVFRETTGLPSTELVVPDHNRNRIGTEGAV